jgi:hypothetical protein
MALKRAISARRRRDQEGCDVDVAVCEVGAGCGWKVEGAGHCGFVVGFGDGSD